MKTKILLPLLFVNLFFAIFAFSQDTIPSIMFGEDTILYIYPSINASEVEWGGFGTLINANYSNGAINTALIVQELGDNNGVPYAAKICDTLTAYGYDDWYLPSSWELWVMCENWGSTGSSYNYSDFWSSNDISEVDGLLIFLGDCSTSGVYKNLEATCRCIRREYLNASSNSDKLIKELKIIPDPASKVVNIKIKGLAEDYDLSIYNIQGVSMESRKIKVTGEGYSCKVDVSQYSKGTYIVKINNGKAVKTEKFVL